MDIGGGEKAPDQLGSISYPCNVIWHATHEDFLQNARIFLAFPMQTAGVFKAGDRITFFSRVVVEPYATLPRGGFMSIGHLSYSHSRLGHASTVGRYCSLAGDIRLMGVSHPTDWVTTNALLYGPQHAAMIRREINPNHPNLVFEDKHLPVSIGNDVWIGESVLLKGGITIGDGAIIGARSVVTRDVPPYSVAAGSPARVRRLRFKEPIVERLRALKWWNYDFSSFAPPWDQIERFLDTVEEGAANGSIRLYTPRQFDLAAELTEIVAHST